MTDGARRGQERETGKSGEIPPVAPNPLGISSGAFWPHRATVDVPAQVARLGVRDVEVMLQDEGEYAPAFARDLRAAFDAAGATVHSVHLKQKFHLVVTGSPAEVAAGWDGFARAIDAVATLGARRIVWHGPSQREPGMPGRMEAFPEAARRLAELCRPAGITLTVENVAYCALPSVRDVRRFREGLDRDGVPVSGPGGIGFTFDPFQAADAGASPLLVLSEMGDRLANVHLSDFRTPLDGESHARHLAPGDGELPWPALLRAVAARYDGPLILETPLGPDPADGFHRIARYLAPLRAAARRDVLATGELPAGVAEGIALFNGGKFYEAHEVLEHEWHAEPGPARELYQGILQLGIGIHHARAGNAAGALIKLDAGLGRLRAFLPAVAGLDIAALVTAGEAYRDAVRAGQPPAALPDPPVIRTRPGAGPRSD
jgi:uncharacterized protein